MAENEVRPVRMCDSCGGVDDHPRHVVWHAPGNGLTSDEVAAKALEAAPKEAFADILAQVRDDTVIAKHMDCCREDGCPDGSCPAVTEGVEDVRGDDLVRYLVGLKDN